MMAKSLLWKYTYETIRLREEAQRQVEISQKQIEVQQRPFVIVQDIIGNKIRLRNIGTSSAINIALWCAKKEVATELNPNPDTIYFSSINIISFIGHTHTTPTPVKVNISTNDEDVSNIPLASESCSFIFIISYSNVEMEKYYTEQGIKATLNEIDEMIYENEPGTYYSLPTSLEIYSSGKVDDRTDKGLILVNTTEDGKTSKFCLTQTGERKLRELENKF